MNGVPAATCSIALLIKDMIVVKGEVARRERFINIAMLMVSLVVALGLVEVLLRLFTEFPINQPLANRTLDDRMLFRVSQRVEGIDRNGFRNPPGHDEPFPRVVAVGDSHTYGYNVERGESWPGQLEIEISKKVYNLGVGQFGYFNNAAAAEYALERGAAVVLFGFHPINDMDVCGAARLAHWSKDFASNPELSAALAERCHVPISKLAGENAYDILGATRKNRLSNHIALLSLVRHVKYSVFGRSRAFLGLSHMQCTNRGGGNDFTFRAGKVDDFIPFSVFGSPIMSSRADRLVINIILQRTARLAQARDAKVHVLALPSRLRVSVDYLAVADPNKPLPDWVKNVYAFEDRQIDYLRAAARMEGLAFADATAETVTAYRRAVDNGQVLYPCVDSHPLGNGYAAYARVAKALVNGD